MLIGSATPSSARLGLVPPPVPGDGPYAVGTLGLALSIGIIPKENTLCLSAVSPTPRSVHHWPGAGFPVVGLIRGSTGFGVSVFGGCIAWIELTTVGE